MSNSVVAFLWLSLCALVYMIPYLIAVAREHPSRSSIFTLNMLLGWTGAGWVGALCWAVWPCRQPPA